MSESGSRQRRRPSGRRASQQVPDDKRWSRRATCRCRSGRTDAENLSAFHAPNRRPLAGDRLRERNSEQPTTGSCTRTAATACRQSGRAGQLVDSIVVPNPVWRSPTALPIMCETADAQDHVTDGESRDRHERAARDPTEPRRVGGECRPQPRRDPDSSVSDAIAKQAHARDVGRSSPPRDCASANDRQAIDARSAGSD